jgi:hypothetical protein
MQKSAQAKYTLNLPLVIKVPWPPINASYLYLMIASFSFYPVSLSVGTPDPIVEEKKETQQFTRGQDRLASRLSTDLTLSLAITSF